MTGRATVPCTVLVLTLSALAFNGGRAAAQLPAERGPTRGLAVVLSSTLNVRSAPELDAPVRAAVARGDTLCVVAFDGDWAEVRTPVGRGVAPFVQGFAARGFLDEVRVSVDRLEASGCATPDDGARRWLNR